MKCEICGGSGTMLDGIEDNGDPCPDCNGTGTKPEPEQDCINPDCIGGWMTEHEDLTELTIPCSRCNVDRHKAKPFFAPKVIVHPRQPEPEQDEMIEELFKKVENDLCGGNNIPFRTFKAGYTSRNAEIEAMKETHELETKGRDELRRADVDCILRLRDENRKQTEEIEALKAEIESMRCCGNCGRSEHQRPTDIELCHHCVRNINYHRTPALDNWTPKSKLCKDSTTIIQEPPCNH